MVFKLIRFLYTSLLALLLVLCIIVVLIFVAIFASYRLFVVCVVFLLKRTSETFKYVQSPIELNSCKYFCDKYSSEPKYAVLITMLVQGSVDKVKVIELLRQKVFNAKDSHGKNIFPTLKQTVRVIGGVHFWEDIRDFNLENHVHLEEYCTSLDKKSFQEGGLLYKLVLRPFKDNEPFWSIHIYPDVKVDTKLVSVSSDTTTDKQSVCVFRYHHGLGTGPSILKIVDKISTTPFQMFKARDYSKPVVKSRHLLSKLCRLVLVILATPYQLAEDVIHSIKAYSSPAGFQEHDDLDLATPKFYSGFSNNIEYKDALSKAKKMFSASGTLVLLDSVMNAVGPSRLAGEVNTFGSRDKLEVIMPVPMVHSGPTLNNAFSIARLRCSLKEESAISRVHSLQAQLERLKSGGLSVFYALGVRYLCLLPRPILKLFAKNPIGTLIISNIAGPINSVDFAGYPLVDVIPFISVPGGGIIVSLFSYKDTLRFSVSGDSRIVKSKETCDNIVDNFSRSFS